MNKYKLISEIDIDSTNLDDKTKENIRKIQKLVNQVDSNIRGDGKSRKFVENVVCFLLRMIFGVKVSDANAPYRLMKSSLVAKYIDKLPEDFNIPNIMFTTYFVHYKEKVQFIDITFKPRQGGTNSINVKKIVKIGWKAVKDFYKLKKEL